MRLIPLLLALILAAGHAYAATTVVYPTGVFPADVLNVQGAIDGGGTVILKATNTSGHPTVFNFGPPIEQPRGGVDIHTDVRIEGEHVGQHNSTIRGGFFPIACSDPVKITIQDITFDGPIDCPIGIFRSTGTSIIGNHVKNIVPDSTGTNFSEVEGLFVVGYPDPQNITGRLKIAENVIEISGGDFANGMQLDDVAADVEISGNNVRFIESNGIIITTGILVVRSHGKTNIISNRVTMGPGAPSAYPSGIFAEGNSDARYLISLNTIVCNHPAADGIDIYGDLPPDITVHGAVVVANDITIHSTIPTSGAIALGGEVEDSLILANRIEGTSGNALQILGFDSTMVADSNRAVSNNIAHHSSLVSDIFFGPFSANNLVTGQCATYIDQGVGNHITCGTPVGSVGPAGRTAAGLSRRLDWLKRDDFRRARLNAIHDRLNGDR